jgi:hypothetical protein
MKFILVTLTLWASAPSGAKIAPTAKGGTSRPMRMKKKIKILLQKNKKSA